MLEENIVHIKLILLGDTNVGKSSIIQRYYEDVFKETKESTINSYFIEKDVKIKNQNIILELWDTAGQEQYRSVSKIFVKNSKIILLVYDVTSKKSFESLNYWYDFITKELGQNIILGLAGNKIDLIADNNYNEGISPEEGREYAENIGATFAQISAKESVIEIEQLINELLTKYLDLKENDISTTGTIKLDERSFTKEINTKKNCCGGKDTNQREIEAIFLGCDGVGKTTIIKALKGKNDYYNLAHTKKEYTEYLTYSKREHNIKVKLREINIDEFNNHYSENRNNQKYKFFFLVFDFYKKDTLHNLKNFINKIDRKYKIYIIGYSNDISENNITDFIIGDEAEKFAKKYGCEYEYITLEEIYKVKAIIIENIGIYWAITNNS